MAEISRRAALGLGAATAAAIGLAVGTPSTAEATIEKPRVRTGVLRIATYNIHYGAGPDNVFDLQHTAEIIAAIGPDLIGLQEVDKFFRPRSNWLDTPAELAQMLDMHVAYGPNIDLDPLEPGQPRRQYGNAVLSRWPILEYSNTRLPQYTGSEPRGLLEALVNVEGTPIRFGTTHMQHTSDAEWQEQADAIADAVDAAGGRYFLVGDTNAVPSFPGMRTFTDRLDDVWAEVGIGEGLSAANTWRFDYIFMPTGNDVRSTWLVCCDASDHLPLVADVDIR
ncbi:endonuclease/exonuclease/phosphatase family protein [Actinopolymorpha sp. NPDC004070]|uniref:endonuclease/exonuclease/phosphatase family protein n=1 Tax=Actinopolymorpha sp. NPDC004070 TaxID=3154548 RepID=UPI0033AF1916